MTANTTNTPITVHINAPASRHYFIHTQKAWIILSLLTPLQAANEHPTIFGMWLRTGHRVC